MKKEMTRMRWWSLAAGLVCVVGCGGSDTGTGTNPATSNGGTGGSTSGSGDTDPRCDMTTCPNDSRFETLNKEDCTNTLAGTCGPQFKAKADCYKAHDKCKADGRQDLSVPQAACTAEDSAFVACGNAQGKGGGAS